MNGSKKVWYLGALILVLCVVRLVGGQQPAKQFFVALYERGPAWVEGKSARDLPEFGKHLEHMRNLGEHRVGAGPFANPAGDSLVGMVVLQAQSEGEARKLAEADPFVVAGYEKVKVWRWLVGNLQGCF